MSPPQLLLPIFGGQGMSSFDSRNGWGELSHLLSSPSGSLLLETCHAAFHEEIASLCGNDRQNVHICADDFKDKSSILYPTNKDYSKNPAISGSILLLEHSLCFLDYLERTSKTSASSPPVLNAMKRNKDREFEILGFSSGILSACVVATSSSIPSFIVNCVEAYRLALWIGIRSKIYQATLLDSEPASQNSCFRPWSSILLEISKNDAYQAVDCFNGIFGLDRVSVTAVMSDDCVTISGHPDDLASFSTTLPHGVTACSTRINALYHCSAKLYAVRNQVVTDIVSRNIRFPTLTDLFIPIRSTLTGDLISSTSSEALVELALDMILMHPVNWDVVVAKTVRDISQHQDITLLNIGLGASLIRRLEGAFARSTSRCHVLDLYNIVSPKIEVKQEPIAIVGMAVNMPGSSTVDKLWDILKEGRNTLTEIPKERFDYELYTNNKVPGRSMKTKTGNFVAAVGHFDHRFFNISPREAKSMDPQQRMLLQVGHEALENAGYVPHASPTFNPDTFGCFIGSATHDFVQNLRNDIDLYYSTGTLGAFLSGRLSYCLGLGGPSIVVDTACSSSMVAIYQASRALMNKDCHAALAGGVNVISSPDMFLGLDKGHFLSLSGQCKSFDAAADGYSRGEGCGIFVLKRLADAVAENDQVLGVIRGIEVNQSGKAQSITHPHAPTQQALFRQLLSCSDVDPNSVNVVEAHGTGTQAGDTNEMESIRHVLNVDRMPNNPLYITSIKANIGHLEAASGCASLAKVLLMLQHGTIPQQISLRTLNPLFSRLDSDNTIIATKSVAWLPVGEGKPRIALINNFGAAGSNAALLLEEYVPPKSSRSTVNGSCHAFGLSAKDKSTLEVMRLRLIKWLQTPQSTGVSLSNIAYTITARRQSYPHRLAVSAATKEDLIKKLEAAPICNAHTNTTPVILVFSGQGCQYRGMGTAFYESSPLFRRHIDECDQILISLGFPGIISFINASDAESARTISDEEEFQTALFSLQYALVKVWLSWGIKPIAIVGHSLGEYAALVTAGVVSLKDALFVVATRARLMRERCPAITTGMVAVSTTPAEVQAVLDSRDDFSGLSISCFNSPKDCVISGPLRQLQKFRRHVENGSMWRTTQLSFPYGAHSPAMAPLLDDLVTVSGKIMTNLTNVPFISTVLGRLILPDDQNFPPVDYFARQCIDPVRFSEGIESYLTNPIFPQDAMWLEVGPHPTILPMLMSFPSLSGSILLGSFRKGQDSWTAISSSLSSLYLSHYPINWRHVFRETGPTKCVNVPSYPFAGPNFWLPFTESNTSEVVPRRQGPKFSFIRNWAQFPDDIHDKTAIFETPISQVKNYIEGHQVGGIPLCPASVYLEMIYAAVNLSMEHNLQNLDGLVLDLYRITFSKALTWNFADEEGNTILLVIVDVSTKTFSLKSRTFGTESQTLHASGEYDYKSSIETQSELSLLLHPIASSVDEILNPINGQTPETFSTRTIYQVIFPRVVEYSKDFHTLRYLAMLPNEMEATATMKVDSIQPPGVFFIHPIFLDTLLHMAGFVANLHGGLNDAYICSEIASIQILPEYLLDKNACYSLYCKLSNHSTESDILGESYAFIEGSEGRVVVAHIKGIRFQRVRLSGLKAGLASISGKFPFGSNQQYEAEEFGNRLSPSNIMTVIRNIIAKSCEIKADDVSLYQELDYLGVDSLMRLELAYDLSHAFPVFGYRPQEISLCKTITDIVDTILANVPGALTVTRDNYQQSPRTPAAISSIQSSPRTLVHYSDTSPPVRRIFAHILDIEEENINDDSELASLGFDSLASIEAAHTLRHKYNLDIPKGFLSPRSTVRDIERQVLKLEPSALPELTSPYQLSRNPFTKMCDALSLHRSLSLLQNSDSKLAPLVLIHDGSGLTVSYERISTQNRRIWAISNPRFSTPVQWDGVIEMAQSYANLILNEIEGPIILGGWSFGGVVAIEVAKQLSSRSMVVHGVILIDSPNPLSHVPLSASLVNHVLDAAQNLDSELRKLCKAQFMMNAKLLSAYTPQRAQEYVYPRIVFLRSVEPYNPPTQDNIPPWLSDRAAMDSVSHGWATISGGRLIGTLDIPGHHFAPFEPHNVAFVSRRIIEACEILDKSE